MNRHMSAFRANHDGDGLPNREERGAAILTGSLYDRCKLRFMRARLPWRRLSTRSFRLDRLPAIVHADRPKELRNINNIRLNWSAFFVEIASAF
jgi:hypothetical protein